MEGKELLIEEIDKSVGNDIVLKFEGNFKPLTIPGVIQERNGDFIIFQDQYNNRRMIHLSEILQVFEK